MSEDVVVTTERFWGLMCDPATIRMDWHRLIARGEAYYVVTPPEGVPGFLAAKTIEVQALLK